MSVTDFTWGNNMNIFYQKITKLKKFKGGNTTSHLLLFKWVEKHVLFLQTLSNIWIMLSYCSCCVTRSLCQSFLFAAKTGGNQIQDKDSEKKVRGKETVFYYWPKKSWEKLFVSCSPSVSYFLVHPLSPTFVSRSQSTQETKWFSLGHWKILLTILSRWYCLFLCLDVTSMHCMPQVLDFQG